MMLRPLLLAPLALSLAACEEGGLFERDRATAVAVREGDGETRPKARPGSTEPAEDAREAAATETSAAVQPDASGRLGTTLASLGDVAESGQWLRTPLVSNRASGRVRDVETGATAQVDLIPIPGEPGAGSRMSLSAFQALGIPITSVAEIEVFVN